MSRYFGIKISAKRFTTEVFSYERKLSMHAQIQLNHFNKTGQEKDQGVVF